MILRLLEKEALLFPSSGVPSSNNDPWREKVIHWFFSVVSALGQNQPAGVQHPFDRTTVHVTTAMMDNYLASLSCERSARLRRDRVAYQVLATSCLLLGMRLVHHQRNTITRQQGDVNNEPSGEMKRTTKHRQNMDQHAQAARAHDADVLEIPNISSILRISAASKSITEARVLAMVREITSCRVFPRSHSVTALDFIQVFATSNIASLTSSSNGSLLLEPSQERNANRLADAGLLYSRCRPSIVACACMTIAMLRSVPAGDIASVRRLVFHSVFGEDTSNMQSVRDMEIRLLRATAAPVRNVQQMPNASSHGSHVIPEEE
jgi:hypothetical protein